MIPFPSCSGICQDARGLPILFLLVFAFFPRLTAGAALPPLSVEARQSQAEVIITGTVLASRVLIVRKPGSLMYLVRLQTALEKVERGGDIIGQVPTEGSPTVIEVRCWRTRKSGSADPEGLSNIPADGSRFRMWLKKGNEGFWEPLEPNGIELLDNSPAMEFTETERRETIRSFLIGIIGTLLIMGSVAVYLFRRSRRTH